jgi:hypothetical protein
MSIARSITLVVALALPLSSSRAYGIDGSAAPQHDNHRAAVSSVLVEKVREATAPFRDVRNVPAGYGPALGCVSGPLTGAMGVHFINESLVGDATLDPARPEALIYESRDGATRFVGVEFIVLFDVWHETHGLQDPPTLEGQLLHFNETPNRFGLPAFYELHVWAWRDNPLGTFADWNSRVSCDAK